MDFSTWLIFLGASFSLALAPGPGMLYVLSRTMSGGKSIGLASTFGTAIGGFLHVIAAALGVSAILASSALAFTLIKWIGAAFLIFLGLKMLVSAFLAKAQKQPILASSSVEKNSKQDVKSAFCQGILAEALNPKTAIFFLAFIPQFIDSGSGAVFLQFMFLGTLVVVINTLPDFLIVAFAKPVERLWNSSQSFRFYQQLLSGSTLIALGSYLALSESNTAEPS